MQYVALFNSVLNWQEYTICIFWLSIELASLFLLCTCPIQTLTSNHNIIYRDFKRNIGKCPSCI